MSTGKMHEVERKVFGQNQESEDDCFREGGHAWVGDGEIKLCIHCGLEQSIE